MSRRGWGAVIVTLVALAGLPACASDRSSDESGQATPLIVDTDGGSDDAMALLYLLQHPAVEVVAITVSGTGLVHCPVGASNVAGLVELASPDRADPDRVRTVEADRGRP